MITTLCSVAASSASFSPLCNDDESKRRYARERLSRTDDDMIIDVREGCKWNGWIGRKMELNFECHVVDV